MKLHFRNCASILLPLVVMSLVLPLSVLAQQASPSRKFTFDYSFTVKNTNPGKSLRVWIPLARSDDHQTVRVLSMNGDLPLKNEREREYGNSLLYATTANADKPEYKFSVKYEVERRENTALKTSAKKPDARAGSAQLNRFLQADKLVPVTGLPAQLAAKEVQGKPNDLDRARALYDYVFNNMKYDKSGTGWGRGDTLWACDSKHGNCTDFHSLFISMARSQGIPARFEIGFSVPEGKPSAEVAGYHCWSEFYLKDRGWIPVDISEAWKHPEKKDYFFGAHDANRVQFSMGRDLQLTPAQDGDRLNYFVYPYVEMDGKAYSNVSLNFSFADEGAKLAAVTGK
ncbi:MAG: transglutaminase-like protein [Acidobacteriaceae bacterium]|nr:transglutaminase-like protein [Acidobacteriaceae bacterium]